MDARTPLERAAKEVGTPTALAKAIGRKQSTVWTWLKRGWPAPDACPAIEAATGGKVTAVELLEPAFKKAAKPAPKRQRRVAA